MTLSRRELLAGGAATTLLFHPGRALASGPGFQVEQVELEVPTLEPEHDGLRVAQLSDIHTGRLTPDGRVIGAVRQVNALAPDVVLLTGDYVTWRCDAPERMAELLKGITAPTVAVLGNHDHWTHPERIQRGLEGCGYAVLRNHNTTLTLRGRPVTFLGVDDGNSRHDDVLATWRGAPASGTRLVLTHTPSTFRKLEPNMGLACFSGHTHGGQWVVPGLTKAALGIAGERYMRGEYRDRGNVLYVNRGLGSGRGGILPRLGSEPELTLFTLRRPTGT
ncbi:metallophosphoesterase [Vitiosangium sp. GDMCC 1.1324]|uniref:metallophosphoesterase n=1 Tax=Vitiosangium sp. (strain GDMCC 1.1324) TaxID=2138576 RepID=UPI000D3934DD|nr:metallophosphoesterase [Vitiosangium sp. GDMCC 1.1324]PTL83617.1 metallophosphatase [Vitiosangium sp. GDMCC 1.1324]